MNTTLCYIEKDGKYLMLHRTKKENDINKDKWIGIGGKFEDAETPFECIRREMKEETGLSPTHLSYRGIVTFIAPPYPTEYMHLFVAKGTEGEIRKSCDEGELEWIDKKELYHLSMWEGDKIFLSLLDRKVPFFSLKLVYKGDKLISHTIEYAEAKDGV